MVQVTADVDSSKVVDETLVITYNIPAITERAARRRAKANSRVAKGIENATVTEVKETESATLPGQTMFQVRVEAPR